MLKGIGYIIGAFLGWVLIETIGAPLMAGFEAFLDNCSASSIIIGCVMFYGATLLWEQSDKKKLKKELEEKERLIEEEEKKRVASLTPMGRLVDEFLKSATAPELRELLMNGATVEFTNDLDETFIVSGKDAPAKYSFKFNDDETFYDDVDELLKNADFSGYSVEEMLPNIENIDVRLNTRLHKSNKISACDIKKVTKK